MLKKIFLLFFIICSASYAAEKSWIVQKWMNNCQNRAENGLNFAFGPLAFKRWNFSHNEINNDCKKTLQEIIGNFYAKKEITFTVKYFIDKVDIAQDIRNEIEQNIKNNIENIFSTNDKHITAKALKESDPIDIAFLVYLSKFPVYSSSTDFVDIFYGRIEGNFYFNSLYNMEYPVGIAYDSRIKFSEGINQDFHIIINDYGVAFKEVMDKNFTKKY